MMKKFFFTIIFTIITTTTFAADQEFYLKIKNHKFIPEILQVPAKKKFKLIVENLDDTVEEFESYDLKKEKIISAGKKITLIIAPLEKGEYGFVGEFHAESARGKLIAQ